MDRLKKDHRNQGHAFQWGRVYKIGLFLIGWLLFGRVGMEGAWAAPADPEAFRAESLQAINVFRQEEGRGTVKLDEALNRISTEWAIGLAKDEKMHHRSLSNLRSLMAEHHWNTINENLFMASYDASVATVIDSWKHSPPHRRDMLQANIDRIGLGFAYDAKGGIFVVFNGAGPEAPLPPPETLGEVSGRPVFEVGGGAWKTR